jgi:hypothetical protein
MLKPLARRVVVVLAWARWLDPAAWDAMGAAHRSGQRFGAIAYAPRGFFMPRTVRRVTPEADALCAEDLSAAERLELALGDAGMPGQQLGELSC